MKGCARMKEFMMSKMAKKILLECLQIKKNEKLLVICDPEKFTIARSIVSSAYSLGLDPVLSMILPRSSHGEEPPAIIADSMRNSDAFLAIVETSITHTHAVKNAIANNSRGLVLTQFTEDMMIKGGIEADFKNIAPKCKALANILANSDHIHLTTLLGTDLTFSAKNRRGNALYGIVNPGEFSTIPTIEANVSPLEGSANGKIIADASIPYLGIGLLNEPVELDVKNGKILSINGGFQAKTLERDLKSKNDENVYNIAELGIGMNPNCSFTGFMLEDEGVCGSVHIGIGTSIALGGTVKAKCHYDLIMTNATLVVDGVKIMEQGNILI
jgi:leucyl aminopeptidase (aminopeptidase T)